MPSLLSEFMDSSKIQWLKTNFGLIIFTLIILAITWSGVKTIQTNFDLQKKIATIEQQNTITDLQNANIKLQNEYFKSDQYLELAARQQLGLAAPGETVWLVPEKVAMRYVNPDLTLGDTPSKTTTDNHSKLVKNLLAWRDFLLGHKLVSD